MLKLTALLPFVLAWVSITTVTAQGLPGATRIEELAAQLPKNPHGLGSTYHNRAAWDALRSRKEFSGTIAAAEKLLTRSYPAWDDAAYLDFSKSGLRTKGQQMLGHRTEWLTPLVLAECLENRGRFMPRIEEVLRELAGQKCWTLPAHDDGLRNFYGRAYSVDLSSSALAHELAQALFFLDDKISAPVRAEVVGAIEARIFKPVRNGLRNRRPEHWLKMTNNWNPVCLSGVTGAALTLLPDPKDRAFFVAVAATYSRNYLSGYTDDGYCNEGVGYYNYGFGAYITLREELWQATGGQLDLFADPKVRKIALFGPNLKILNGCWPSFADCRPGSKPSPEILDYCNRAIGLGLTINPGGDYPAGSLSEIGMWAFPNSLSKAKVSPSRPAPETPGLRTYFADAGVLICRPAKNAACRMGVALKGGHNAESHNHNDLGSYALVLGNEQLVGDPGGPYAYTAKTFGPERYTAFKMFASFGHPVPLVAGVQQKPGRDAQAKVLAIKTTDLRDDFTLDLGSAYPVPTLKKLVRTFTYQRERAGSLTIRDDFELAKPAAFETAIITRAKWRQTGPDTLEFSLGGETLLAQIQTPKGGFELVQEVITENAPPFTRIGLRLKKPVASGSVTVTFRPANQ